MRQVPSTIWNLWDNGGPYLGDDAAPHSRVTVEPTWLLTTSMSAGNFSKLPARWWQRADNGQSEAEVPNIRQIDIERSLDSDAATCTITLSNQWHYTNGELTTEGELGQPGYFSFNRGESGEAQARWGQVPNSWNGVLVPNALLRTYQGYGGKSLTWDEALSQGFILLTGVWLIDAVSIRTDGTISLQCRDMAKLLIDQFIFPPLVPPNWYPLTYCRWFFDKGHNEAVPHDVPQGYARIPITYTASSFDEGGNNTAILGHRPTDALDQNSTTYWLSGPRTSRSEFIYYEAFVNDRANAAEIAGHYPGYQVYVSIQENGAWVGANTVPAPAGYNIPYVAQSGSDGDGNAGVLFDRVYQAQLVRYTFTNLHLTSLEGTTYRVGAEEITLGRIETTLPTKRIISMAPIPSNKGYWLCGNDGGVFSLGNGIQFYGSSGGGGTVTEWSGISAMPNGTGYYTCRGDGKVFAFGSANHHGDMFGQPLTGPIVDMGITPDGGGYWLLGADGGVFAFGNANGTYGNAVGITGFGLCIAFAERPQGDGYWILFTSGHVSARGGAPSHPQILVAGNATGICSNLSGSGYRIVTGNGEVYTLGTGITDHGGVNNLPLVDSCTNIVNSTTAAGDGYYICAGDGAVFAKGDATFWGSLTADFSWSVRKQGNYKDYTDIIKDLLLWSGWWLNNPNAPGSSPPEVFGNIETTGVFDASLNGPGTPGTGEGCLPEDVFDKKPVIDAITTLKEIVGFNFWIDEEGGARFELPNWYTPGNRIMDDASHTTFVPQVDESTNLIDYSVDYTDSPVRSEIIIASADPDANLTGTKTARLTVSDMAPESTALLRGMTKPAMWVNESFQNQKELDVMAKRVATQILFNQRTAHVTCAFNPAIQMNDQVTIFERQTAETYVHYVRGVHISHDLESGKMEMQLTTHWLGTGSNFIIDTWGTP